MTLTVDLPGHTLPIPEASSENPRAGQVAAADANLTRRAVEQRVYNYAGRDPVGGEVSTTADKRLSVTAPSMLTRASIADDQVHGQNGRTNRFSMASMASEPDSMCGRQSREDLPCGLTAVPRGHFNRHRE